MIVARELSIFTAPNQLSSIDLQQNLSLINRLTEKHMCSCLTSGRDRNKGIGFRSSGRDISRNESALTKVRATSHDRSFSIFSHRQA
jgi:hypothetical protein